MRHFWQYKSRKITIEAEPRDVIAASNALFHFAKQMEGIYSKKDLQVLKSISTKLYNAAQFRKELKS
jgi:hypothetical protein